ncbi:MFS transporter [Actinomadura sp. SCN-SB]|uniref:MFS transporter n=1 Tax=Actinomadura sp. SCN-SB TaxID=3373092 RepID=UPI003751E77E
MPSYSWEREFRLLWTGSAVSQFGAAGATMATPLLALSLSGSPVSAGLATAAGTLPGLMFQLPAGWLADRADRHRIMMTSQGVRLVATLVLIVGLGLVGGPFWLLIVVVVVVGVAAVFHDIAENARVRDILYGVDDTPRPYDADMATKRKSAMAGHEARVHIAQVTGRPLGGLLFGYSHLLPYVIEAGTAFFSLFMMRLIGTGRAGAAEHGPPRRRQGADSGRRFFQRAREEIASSRKLLTGDRFLLTVLTVCTVANFLFQVVVLLLIVSADRRGTSTSLTGLLLSASGIGGMAGAFAAPRLLRKRRPQTIVLWCVWSWFVLVLLVALVRHPLVGFLAWGSCSYMGAHVNIALEVHKGDRVPREHQGKITSIGRFLTSGAIPLGALCGGYLIAALNPVGAAALVALVMGALVLVVTAGMLLGDRDEATEAAITAHDAVTPKDTVTARIGHEVIAPPPIIADFDLPAERVAPASPRR